MSSKGKTIISTANGAFSGADIVAHIIFPGKAAIRLGQVTTLTYSTYRETSPVRTLGRINVKGFSRGQRTIAGTIIFTVFEKHVVNQLKEEIDYLKYIKKLKPCELPPFDIMLSFGNEYGSSAKLFVYGVEVVDEGKIFSVEDMFTENTWSYMARDIDLMDDIDAEQHAPLLSLGEKDSAGKFKVDDLVMDDDYIKMQEELEKLKDEKQQAIEDAREQNKDFISNKDDFNQGTLPPIPPIATNPGWENPPVDPEQSQCIEPSLENYKKPKSKPTVEQGKTLIFIEAQFNMAKVYQEKEITKAIVTGDKFPIKIEYRCSHGGYRVWSSYKFLADGVTDSGKNGVAKMILIGDGLFDHKPDFPSIKVTLPKTITYGSITFDLSTAETVEYGNLGTSPAAPMKFVYNDKGGKEHQANDAFKDLKAKVTFTPISKAITTLPVRGGGSNTQYIFRDATTNFYKQSKGFISTIISGSLKPEDYYDSDNAYFTTKDSWMHSQHISNYHVKEPGVVYDKKPFDREAVPKLMPGFLATFSFTDKSGKAVKVDTSKLYLRCYYRVLVIAKNGSGTYKTYVLDGMNKNNNMATKLANDSSDRWLKLSKPKKYRIDQLETGNPIEPFDQELEFIFLKKDFKKPDGLAKHIHRAVHLQSAAEGVDSKHFSKKDIDGVDIDKLMGRKLDKDGNKYCQCRFKYSKMTFEAYEFVIVNEHGAELIPTTNFSNLLFPVSDMTDSTLEYLKPLVNKK